MLLLIILFQGILFLCQIKRQHWTNDNRHLIFHTRHELSDIHDLFVQNNNGCEWIILKITLTDELGDISWGFRRAVNGH